MATTTPNLGLTKPEPGGDDDGWAPMLNGNADILDVQVKAAQDAAAAANANANGRVSKAGDTMTGGLAVSPAAGTAAVLGANATGAADATISASVAAGRSGAFQLNTAGVARWQIRKTAGAESGSNAGSDLSIDAYADNGTLLGAAFTLSRNSRSASVTGSLAAAGLHSSAGIFLTGYDSAGGADFGKALFFGGSWSNTAMYIQSAHQPGVNAWMNIVCGTGWMQLNASGSLTVSSQGFKPGGGAWADSSDRRFKDGIEPYRTGLGAILQVAPKVYSFKAGTGRDPARRFIGAIAQDIEGVMPEMVSTGRQTLGEIALDDARTLDPSALPWALVNAIQDLHAIVQAQAARIAALEAVAA